MTVYNKILSNISLLMVNKLQLNAAKQIPEMLQMVLRRSKKYGKDNHNLYLLAVYRSGRCSGDTEQLIINLCQFLQTT